MAAAAAALVLAPAVLRKAPTVPVAETAAAWEAPDLDTLWEDASVLDLEASATGGDGADAAYAALDF